MRCPKAWLQTIEPWWWRGCSWGGRRHVVWSCSHANVLIISVALVNETSEHKTNVDHQNCTLNYFAEFNLFSGLIQSTLRHQMKGSSFIKIINNISSSRPRNNIFTIQNHTAPDTGPSMMVNYTFTSDDEHLSKESWLAMQWLDEGSFNSILCKSIHFQVLITICSESKAKSILGRQARYYWVRWLLFPGLSS